jgi:hypothetical protein
MHSTSYPVMVVGRGGRGRCGESSKMRPISGDCRHSPAKPSRPQTSEYGPRSKRSTRDERGLRSSVWWSRYASEWCAYASIVRQGDVVL